MGKVIKKESIPDLFHTLSGYEIWGPRVEDGIVLYRPLDGGEPAAGFRNAKKPPKEIFFPQTETMFAFHTEGGKVVGLSEPPLKDRSILLFGVRPCDARAFGSLDGLFNWDYKDPYYNEKRNRATVISITCMEPEQSCFCSSVGGSPYGTEGADMLWTDIGDFYYVESFTDKGGKIEEHGSSFFQAASPDQDQKASESKRQVEAKISRNVDLSEAEQALEASFDSPYWQELARRCLGCGICTLLCPTCHCFDINDMERGGRKWRERNWDSCQFSHYTVHASGHNPRPAKEHRQRNRVFHKFLNMKKRLGVPGCVGCGRCISGCPVNIDILEVIEDVINLKAKETTG